MVFRPVVARQQSFPPVAVTAVVAICSAVAQLLGTGLMALCFHTPAHPTRLMVLFALYSWRNPEYLVDDVTIIACIFSEVTDHVVS